MHPAVHRRVLHLKTVHRIVLSTARIDAMQAAVQSLGQHIVPETPSAIGGVAGLEALSIRRTSNSSSRGDRAEAATLEP